MTETTPKKERTKCEVYSRIVGYLRPVDQWNIGKKEEFKERKVFKIPEVSNARKSGGRIRREN